LVSALWVARELVLLNRDPEYVGDHKARINWRRDGRKAIDRKRCDEA
jgi:hypothetical protein